MADIVLPVVGGVTGFVLGGPSGAILGANLGSTAAGLFFPKSQRVQLPTQEGPRLADLRAQTATYGNMIPKVYGTMRLAGNVIWSTDLKEVKVETTSTQTAPAVAVKVAAVADRSRPAKPASLMSILSRWPLRYAKGRLMR